jgi:methylglutaconyl-CoA hydratase
MTEELVHLAVGAGIATITLDSPHNRNALSRQLRTELLDRFDRALDDDAVRVIVLTHDGPAFCAGADLKETSAQRGVDPEGASLPAILERIWTSPKPVVARITGPARAGGLGLVAACDIAIAADTVSFALTEVRIGVVPAIITAVILPRTSPAAIHELMLTGDRFDARRAVEIGLINHAVAADDIDAEVGRFTDMLALGGPLALAGTKQMLRMRRPGDIAEELAELGDLSARYFGSAEGAEGMRAFIDKRAPAWVPRDFGQPGDAR